ncbi:hypothetical protein CJ030_MR4G016020 [Morella rubra]|uniref:Secologanin synthase n=1 Tax=Morella rubra TaxID=262757 RepID=A0A6A1VYK8_9ROSI|nr:hypothetical protein CJ030_MR4G016020 [Morella rubra]
MEIPVAVGSIAFSICIAILLTCSWRVLDWVWMRPKKLEKCLRQQGYNPTGDLKDMFMLEKHAKSRPMGLSDDPPPFVIPFFDQTVKIHGKNSFVWIGPTPMVNIINPEQLRDIFSRINEFQRPKLNPLAKFIATGLPDLEGEKWVKNRKLISPAFSLEKLKHILPKLYQSCSGTVDKWESLVSNEVFYELDVALPSKFVK